jgi:hypothetical protein
MLSLSEDIEYLVKATMALPIEDRQAFLDSYDDSEIVSYTISILREMGEIEDDRP